MTPGDFAAFSAIAVTVVIASIGGTLKLAQRRADRAARETEVRLREREARLRERDRKIELLEQAADKQDDVIAELRSQRDKLEITAGLMDRFFGQLPKRRDTGE